MGGASNPGVGIRLGRRASVYPRGEASAYPDTDAKSDMTSRTTTTGGVPLSRALRPRGPVRLGVSESRQPESVMVGVDGELDLLTAPRLATRLNRVMRESGGDVVVDLRELEFIDSAGLQVLLGARRRLTRASRNLAVLCDDGPVRRVIELARLVETLGVRATLDSVPTG